MPSYHCNIKTVSRVKSAAAICDYIERRGRYSHDAKEVLAAWANNIPSFAGSASDYFAAADKYERLNGRLGKTLTVALPVELGLSEQRKIMEAICGDIFLEKTPYLVAIHAGDGRNPHAHIFVSERVVTSQAQIAPDAAAFFRRGTAKKTVTMKTKKWLHSVRDSVARRQNEALQSAGISARVDHRSYAAQGVTDRVAQRHRGPLSHMAKRLRVAAEKAVAELRETERQIADLRRQAEALRGRVESESERQDFAAFRAQRHAEYMRVQGQGQHAEEKKYEGCDLRPG